MHVALIGATGNAGSRILTELLQLRPPFRGNASIDVIARPAGISAEEGAAEAALAGPQRRRRRYPR